MKTYRIDGKRFGTAEAFFDEIDQVLAPDIEWSKTLEGFDELLASGSGVSNKGFKLIWENSKISEQHLGYPETVRYLSKEAKRAEGDELLQLKEALEYAKRNEGPTLFEYIVGLILDHGVEGSQPSSNVVLELTQHPPTQLFTIQTKEPVCLNVRSVTNRLRQFFDEAAMGQWLITPHPQLDGNKPVDVMMSGRLNRVHDLIDRFEKNIAK